MSKLPNGGDVQDGNFRRCDAILISVKLYLVNKSTMARKLKGRQIIGKGLKGSLQHHILKEKYQHDRQKSMKEEIERREHKAKSIKGGGKNKKTNKPQNHKAFIPFLPSDTLLLVGEGDFSFAASIVRQLLIDPLNLIATSYDSKQEVVAKYPGAEENLEFLTEEGVQVFHEVDATNLAASLKLPTNLKKGIPKLFSPSKKLNYVMFNFPHTGRGMKDTDRNIRDHQNLVLGYFKSAKQLFKAVNDDSKNSFGGYVDIQPNTTQKIILSLFEGEPYISWGVKSLARSEDFRVERSGAFTWSTFEGYHHKRTNGIRDTTKPAAERDARIYVFEKFVPNAEKTESQRKKKANDSDSDDD